MATREDLLKIFPKEQVDLNPDFLKPEFQIGVNLPNIPGSITSAALAPTSTPSFQNPPIPTIPVVADTKDFTPAPLGSKETERSELIKQIRALDINGKTAVTAEQEKTAGLSGLQTQEADIFSQLQQQRAEFENIQAQGPAIEARLQQQAEGRGITAGGLAPLTAGELRKNALRAIEAGSRVNMTAALLAGIQGKITTAKTLVDRAVQQKFGAIEEERNAKIANLELLLKDPSINAEQKARAEAQIAKQKKDEKADTKKKEDVKTISEWGVELAKLGKKVEAQKLIELAQKDTPSVEEAFAIYSPLAKKIETGQSEFERAFFREHGRLPTATELAQKKPDSGDTSEEAIDVWARRINSGTDKISSVPNNIRNRVIAKTKQFAEEDLNEDINAGLTQGLKQDALIKQLQTAYPEFSKAEIENKIKTSAAPIAPEKKGFISNVVNATSSFFGSLFR